MTLVALMLAYSFSLVCHYCGHNVRHTAIFFLACCCFFPRSAAEEDWPMWFVRLGDITRGFSDSRTSVLRRHVVVIALHKQVTLLQRERERGTDIWRPGCHMTATCRMVAPHCGSLPLCCCYCCRCGGMIISCQTC